jgi:hypothetical protein
MKTHQYILLAFAFFGFGIIAHAQENKLGSPTVAQVPDISKEYRSPDGRFKIRFPDVPKEVELPYDTKIGQTVFHIVAYVSEVANVTWMANYIDYQIVSVTPDQA